MAVLLEASRPLTGLEIRARVPGYPDVDSSFRRAFERDKDDLRDMGVPLRIEPIPLTDPPVEGYRIRKQDYYLRDPGLEPAELEALNLAACNRAPRRGTGHGGALEARGAVPSSGGSGRTDAGPGVGSLPVDANLVSAFTGVMERRVLQFRYREVAREVNPYRLDFVRGRWYLNGFDQVRGEERWYRLSRVDGPIVAGDRRNAFVRPEEAVAGLQLDPWLLGEGKPMRARVLFDAEQAPAGSTQHRAGPHRRGAGRRIHRGRLRHHQPRRVPILRALLPRSRGGSRTTGTVVTTSSPGSKRSPADEPRCATASHIGCSCPALARPRVVGRGATRRADGCRGLPPVPDRRGPTRGGSRPR